MFKCKVCAEKDARIADLKEQLKIYQAQLIPEPKIRHYEMEQDYILDGANAEQLMPIEQEAANQDTELQDAIQHEQDMILTGSY